VELPAYGIADAEHVLEKEIARLWPEARLQILATARVGNPGRIVEEFSLSYLLEATLEVDADSRKEAESAAFRAARAQLEESRYKHTRWEAGKGGSASS
jgi:hypothetical protein